MAQLPWKGDQVKAKVRSLAARKIEAACILVQNEAKTLLVAQDNIDGKKPSAPGEPPAKVKGRLSMSVSREVDDNALVGRVGSNVLYAKFLELGTTKMAPRPWLRVALANCLPKIKALFGGKKK